MNLTKDMYEYLLNFADDKDIINMLSTNKKFRDETLFERIVKRRYSELVSFKNTDETFQYFFIKMIYYISKLKELYDIPYFVGINPQTLYEDAKTLYPQNFLHKVMIIAIRNGNLDVVKLMVRKGVNRFDSGLAEAAGSGHLDIVKYFIELNASEYSHATKIAAKNGKIDIIDYFIEKKYIKSGMLNLLLLEAAKGNQFPTVKYLINKGANNFQSAISRTDNPEIKNYLQKFL